MKNSQNNYGSYQEFKKALLPNKFAEKKHEQNKPLHDEFKKNEALKPKSNFGLN